VQQQLDRIGVLLPLLIVSNSKERVTNSIVLDQTLIQYNCKKNNIVKLIADSTQTLAYEITQHTAKTGEHYITQSRKQYLHMLYTAMGGGLIVGFLCIFKVLASKADVSDFGQAVIYSLNYAIGFIIIYLLGFTLATKQPAMTAAAIVQTIEIGYAKSITEKDRHIAFAKLFAQLFRSQFIAFVGNVIIAFPVAFFLVYATLSLFGSHWV
jgi:site-specific recombinase